MSVPVQTGQSATSNKHHISVSQSASPYPLALLHALTHALISALARAPVHAILHALKHALMQSRTNAQHHTLSGRESSPVSLQWQRPVNHVGDWRRHRELVCRPGDHEPGVAAAQGLRKSSLTDRGFFGAGHKLWGE